MRWLRMAVCLYIYGTLTMNGILLLISPRLHHYLPFLFRLTPIFNCSYGPAGGANKYPVNLLVVRIIGAIYLIPVIVWSVTVLCNK